MVYNHTYWGINGSEWQTVFIPLWNWHLSIELFDCVDPPLCRSRCKKILAQFFCPNFQPNPWADHIHSMDAFCSIARLIKASFTTCCVAETSVYTNALCCERLFRVHSKFTRISVLRRFLCNYSKPTNMNSLLKQRYWIYIIQRTS